MPRQINSGALIITLKSCNRGYFAFSSSGNHDIKTQSTSWLKQSKCDF